MKKNIIVADKQYITRIGIETLIKKNDEIRVALSYADSKSSLFSLLTTCNDALVIVDHALFGWEDAEEVLNMSFRFPQAHWLLFSDKLNNTFLKRVLYDSKDFSILLKTSDLSEINTAIILTCRNERFVCSHIVNQLVTTDKNEVQNEKFLTFTEKEVLREIALGKTTKEIAANRYLSFHTIITHRKNIFRKLKVNNVHEAVKYAMRSGIIDASDYYI